MESWTSLHYSFCVLCLIEIFHISISATLLSRAVIIANITELRQSGHIHRISLQQKLKPQVKLQCPVMAISVSVSCSFPKVHLLSLFLLACWDHCVGVSVWGFKLISCKRKGVCGGRARKGEGHTVWINKCIRIYGALAGPVAVAPSLPGPVLRD